jgi:ketosteroid isomerase-like protein
MIASDATGLSRNNSTYFSLDGPDPCGLDMRAVSVTAKTLITAVFLTAACGRVPKREGDLEAVRVEILAIEKQWASAIERQDAAAFERLAAEDFRFIEENGRMLNRAQYIADRSHNPDNVESAVQDEIEVRQYGDAAVATGRSILHGTRNGVPFVYRFRWTDLYVRRAGRWQAVSAQLTPLSP